MSIPYERQQDRLEELLRRLLPDEPAGSGLSPEDEAFLSSLGVNTLKFINGLYQRYDGYDFEPVNEELRREIKLLDKMDKAGELPSYWWQSHVPVSVAKR